MFRSYSRYLSHDVICKGNASHPGTTGHESLPSTPRRKIQRKDPERTGRMPPTGRLSCLHCLRFYTDWLWGIVHCRSFTVHKDNRVFPVLVLKLGEFI